MNHSCRNQDGLTIIELMIALTITVFAILVAVSSFTDLSNRIFKFRNQAQLARDGLLVSEILNQQIGNLAGGVQPAGYLVQADNKCSSNPPLPSCPSYNGVASDRLIVLSFD